MVTCWNRLSSSVGLALVVALFLGVVAHATPPNGDDPDLRLWLRADDLTGAVADDPVLSWTDASSYQTVFAPRPGRLEEPFMAFETFPGNPNPVPVVKFELIGPLADGNQQRLYQSSNLAPEFDPLNFGNGNDFTGFIVFKPVLGEGEGGPNDWPVFGVQCMAAKRGTNESVWSMQIDGRDDVNKGKYVLVQYDTPVTYYSDDPASNDTWNIICATIDDNGSEANTDEVTWYEDAGEDSDSRLVQLNDPLFTANRNSNVPEPGGIGGHSQICCGEGERFNGMIAEIIVYSKKLSPIEFQEVQDYLNIKYFTEMQPPTRLNCVRSPDGNVVNMTWDNVGAYDSMVVRRNGADIATIASDATSYQDVDVPPGSHTYQVVATRGGLTEGPLCSVTGAVRFSTPDPGDPTLRLWLRGADLAPVRDPNPDDDRLIVTEWRDASSYGTVLGIREGDEGEPNPNFMPGIDDRTWIGDEPAYELTGFPGNPNPLPTVLFEAAGPPEKGNQDRLVQLNNLGDGDPLNIGDGNGLTIIALFNPLVTGSGALGFQSVLAKRGTTSSVYSLQLNPTGELLYVTYDPSTAYSTDDPIAPNTWHIMILTVDEAGANDVLRFFGASEETLSQTLSPLTSEPLAIDARNASTVEPFYLGGHAQECCGDGERFAGRIAEIMIYAREIDGNERDALFGYLNTKYFSANQPPEALVCTREGEGDVVDLSWSNQLTYDSITIERDGVEIASLAGFQSSFQDTNVPPGSHKYDVVAAVGSLRGGPTCTVRDPAGADVRITALTFYGTDDQGTVRIEERWNTQYPDAAWDIGLLDGPVVDDPAAYASPDWLNLTDGARNASVDIVLVPGDTRTFTFMVGRVDTFPNWYGMNIFLNNSELQGAGGTALLSAFTFSSDFGFPSPFEANSALATMGWPIADIPGSGSLVFEDIDNNVRVTIDNFAVYTQDGLNGGAGIDVIQNQDAGQFAFDGTDGSPELFGEFTLVVESLDGNDGLKFRRGDHDGSGLADITDALNLLGFLFLGSTPPICNNASDFDNSGALDITDALILLGHLFLGQPNAIPAPGTSCGVNPDTPQPGIDPIPPQDVSDLGCETYPGLAFPEAACP